MIASSPSSSITIDSNARLSPLLIDMTRAASGRGKNHSRILFVGKQLLTKSDLVADIDQHGRLHADIIIADERHLPDRVARSNGGLRIAGNGDIKPLGKKNVFISAEKTGGVEVLEVFIHHIRFASVHGFDEIEGVIFTKHHQGCGQAVGHGDAWCGDGTTGQFGR